jgi:hypothetical protein
MVRVMFGPTDVLTTRFYTYPERSEKSFDMTPLTELPDGIANIFVPQKKSGNDFIDYEEFFEKSLILTDEVLGTFREQLKNHLLSSVQVCLGEIETWLMEPASNMNYLESKFDIKIDLPENDVPGIWVCECPRGTHDEYFHCLRCNTRCSNHYGADHKCHPNYDLHFSCDRRSHLLREVTTNDCSGMIDLKYDISLAGDRKRLEKVLELIDRDE